MVIAEAMQYGCVPVCLDSFSSLKDIVDHNENGIIVDKGNSPEEWSRALTALANNGDQLELMSRNAKAKARNFNIKSVITHWEKLFNESIPNQQ